MSAQGVQKMLGAYIMLCVYLFTLQVRLAAFAFRYEPLCVRACVRQLSDASLLLLLLLLLPCVCACYAVPCGTLPSSSSSCPPSPRPLLLLLSVLRPLLFFFLLLQMASSNVPTMATSVIGAPHAHAMQTPEERREKRVSARGATVDQSILCQAVLCCS